MRTSKNQTEDDLRESFWSSVDKKGVDECWLWQGPLGTFGAPAFQSATRFKRTTSAPRFMWEEVNGKVPDNLVVDRPCIDGRCLNPSHLRLVTRSELKYLVVERETERRLQRRLRTLCGLQED